VATGGGMSETTICVAGLWEKVTRSRQPTEYWPSPDFDDTEKG
jgi:hypothetical protein